MKPLLIVFILSFGFLFEYGRAEVTITPQGESRVAPSVDACSYAKSKGGIALGCVQKIDTSFNARRTGLIEIQNGENLTVKLVDGTLTQYHCGDATAGIKLVSNKVDSIVPIKLGEYKNINHGNMCNFSILGFNCTKDIDSASVFKLKTNISIFIFEGRSLVAVNNAQEKLIFRCEGRAGGQFADGATTKSRIKKTNGKNRP
jgi:hypothetical protein